MKERLIGVLIGLNVASGVVGVLKASTHLAPRSHYFS